VPPHDAAEEKTELALVFDDAEFQPDLDAPNGGGDALDQDVGSQDQDEERIEA